MNGVQLPEGYKKPPRGGSLLFTTKFPETPGTHLIDLERMKGRVDLEATQWFRTPDHWIGNPVPYPLGHCSGEYSFYHFPIKTLYYNYHEKTFLNAAPTKTAKFLLHFIIEKQ